MRTTASCRSSRWFFRLARSANRSGSLSDSPGGASEMPVRVFHRASRSAAKAPRAGSEMVSQRPGASTSMAAVKSSITSSRVSRDAPSLLARRAAIVSARAEISAVATEVMRPSSSWASSIITASCSGSTATSASASIASSAWLVTTTSTSLVRSRAISAKHSSPCGQREAPRHSLEVTDTCRHAMSGTPGTKSSRSPVSVSCAHSATRLTCLPSQDRSSSSMRESEGSSSSESLCRQT